MPCFISFDFLTDSFIGNIKCRSLFLAEDAIFPTTNVGSSDRNKSGHFNLSIYLLVNESKLREEGVCSP